MTFLKLNNKPLKNKGLAEKMPKKFVLTNTNRMSVPITHLVGVFDQNTTCRGTLREVLEMMTSPDLQSFTEKARKARAEDPKHYKTLKEQEAPGFLLGHFTVRKDDACETIVPVMGFDVDGVKDELNLSLHLAQCREIPYVFAAFPSLSGRGLRVLVLVDFPPNPKAFKQSYGQVAEKLARDIDIPTDKQLRKKLKAGKITSKEIKKGIAACAHLDTSTSNLSRVWLYGYVDPEDFYLNKKAELFSVATPKEPAPKKQEPNRKVDTVWTDEERVEIIRQMAEQRASGGGRNNFVYLFACLMNEHGVGKDLILRTCLEYEEPDFDSREIRKTVQSAIKGTEYGKYSEQELQGWWRKYQGKSSGSHPTAVPSRYNGGTASLEDDQEKKTGEEHFDLEATPAPKQLIIDGNCYYWQGSESKTKISNFIFIPLYLLKNEENSKRLFQIINQDGDTETVCLTAKQLASKQELVAAIEGRGNYIINWTPKQFSGIKTAIFYEVKTADEITVLGYQQDTGVYAFANGIIDKGKFYEINEFGISETPSGIFYLPALSSINKDAKNAYVNERRFFFKPGEIQAEEWLKLFYEVYGENGIIGICFLLASLHRDVIFNSETFFPLFFLFGPRGTGKTTFRESLARLFGEPQSAISLGSASSPKGFARKLAQNCNAIICFEEYKNNIKASLIEMMKGIYDGIGYERAVMSNDNRTHSSPVLSGCIVAGQEMPTQEAALFSRSILVEFSSDTWSEAQRLAYQRLKASEEKGLGHVLIALFNLRKEIVSQYPGVFRHLVKKLKADSRSTGVSDRNIKNTATILAPLHIVSEHLEFPFSFDVAFDLATQLLKDQQNVMMATNEVNEFWQAIAFLAQEEKVSSSEYHYNKKDNYLCIRYGNLYPKYNEHCRKQGINPIGKQTLLKYLKQQPNFIPCDKPGQDVHKDRFFGGKVRSCYRFNYDEIKPFFDLNEINS